MAYKNDAELNRQIIFTLNEMGVDTSEIYCPHAQDKPCNIIDIAEKLTGHLALVDGAESNGNGHCNIERAAARHDNTNYDDVLSFLPSCWKADGACSDRNYAYHLIKMSAKQLVQP